MLEGMFVAYLVNIVEERDICPEALDLTVDLEKDWLKSDTEHEVVEGITLVPTPAALNDSITIDKFCLTSIQILSSHLASKPCACAESIQTRVAVITTIFTE